MYRRVCPKVFFLFCMVVLLVSCSDVNTVFPSGTSSYQVSAYVISPEEENAEALRTSGYRGSYIKSNYVMRTGDAFGPEFLHPVMNDPDLTGLHIHIEDSAGRFVGEAVRYSLPDKNALEYDGVLIQVDNFNSRLPVFSLPEDLSVGRYTLFFDVLGENNILYQSSQSFYYVADLPFSLDGMRTYLPGKFDGPELIPSGSTILLEAVITADARFDPYIVWYNGNNKIGEGRLSEHYHHLLWTVPKTADFPKIRAEVFPLLAGDRFVGGVKGIARELSLPVSDKANITGIFGKNGGEALYWYQFSGNLHAEAESVNNNAVLVKVQDDPPRFAPLNEVYGLLVGEGNSYSIPDFSVPLNNGSDTEYDLYTLYTRFAPKNEGILFRGEFDTSGSDLSSLILEVLLEEDGLVLSIQDGQSVYRKLIFADISEKTDVLFGNDDFVIAALKFYSLKNRFTADLELQDIRSFPLNMDEISITYRGVLSGAGSFYFGAKENAKKEAADDGNNADVNVKNRDIAIIDEFFLEHKRQSVNR